jgi:Rad3-related DNA helicase
MGEKEREQFLENFQTVYQDRSQLGLCILGGIFSEGIDLTSDRLIGAIIVGTGIPQVCAERRIVKDYFDGRGEDGYAYAYRYPGMNKVLQAAGRVIRTREDVGIVALLDDRFLTPAYRKLFPAEWADLEETNTKEVSLRVCRFWDSWL